MVLGFQEEFHVYVWEGSKTHTVRGGNRWRSGMMCHCFAFTRTHDMALIGKWECMNVAPIDFVPHGSVTVEDCYESIRVFIDGQELDASEKDAFAWRDGFRAAGVEGAFRLMAKFWLGKKRLLDGKPWRGQVIYWDYNVKTRAATVPTRKAAAA